MAMRSIPTTVLVCLMAVCLAACATKPRPVAQKGQIIAITDSILACGGSDTIRLGSLHSGEIAVVQFALRNETARPFVMLDYGRNCGCATLDYDNQPIAPNGSLPLTLTFDSRGEYGWQLKTLDIKLSGGSRAFRIFVEADVE